MRLSIPRRPLLEAAGLLLLALIAGTAALYAAPAPMSSGGRPLPDISTLTPAEAMALGEQHPLLFVDARSLEEYQAGHVAGAALLPFGRAMRDDGPLTLVIYCDDAQCGKAETLAQALTDRAVRIMVMPEGVSGWFSEEGALEATQ